MKYKVFKRITRKYEEKFSKEKKTVTNSLIRKNYGNKIL